MVIIIITVMTLLFIYFVFSWPCWCYNRFKIICVHCLWNPLTRKCSMCLTVCLEEKIERTQSKEPIQSMPLLSILIILYFSKIVLISTCVIPVSSVQNSLSFQCSLGWTNMWNSDSRTPEEVFRSTAGNSTVDKKYIYIY